AQQISHSLWPPERPLSAAKILRRVREEQPVVCGPGRDVGDQAFDHTDCALAASARPGLRGISSAGEGYCYPEYQRRTADRTLRRRTVESKRRSGETETGRLPVDAQIRREHHAASEHASFGLHFAVGPVALSSLS